MKRVKGYDEGGEGFAVVSSIVPTTVIVAWMSVLGVNPDLLGLIWVTLMFIISGFFVWASR